MILVINPGATSTKAALYENRTCIRQEPIRHPIAEIAEFSSIQDQFDFRLGLLQGLIADWSVDHLDAVVGRGGILGPLPAGTYQVNQELLYDLVHSVSMNHASNLGGQLAHRLANDLGAPAFIVDPVSVDEFGELARVSGIPELPRRSFLHALNIRAVAHRIAAERGKTLSEMNLIVVHLGSGISICAMENGQMVDVNNASEAGPMSPDRAGSVTALPLATLCYSGTYTREEMVQKLVGHGGWQGHLGTTDAQQVWERVQAGDSEAQQVWEATTYQVAREIGAMATVLKGCVEAIVITGGLAFVDGFVDRIRTRVEFIAPICLVPGEDELQALAEGAYRVLDGQEKAVEYQSPSKVSI